MKIKLPLFFFLLLRFNCLGQITFQKTFDENGMSDIAYSVQQTTDSGYILTGMSYDSVVQTPNIFLIKTDAFGNTIWSKAFGGLYTDVGYSVIQSNDGGYVITGSTTVNLYFTAVILIKTDSNGDTLWVRKYGSGGVSIGHSVQQTSDNGFILSGETNVFGAGNMDVYLIKTDSLGNLIWSKTFGGSQNDVGRSVQQTSDNGYIIVGESGSFGLYKVVYLIKTDTNGDTLWVTSFQGENGIGESVYQTSDGGFIIGGVLIAGGLNNCAYIIKTDSIGNLIWKKTYGTIPGMNQVFSLAKTSDGGFVTTGEENYNDHNVCITKMDSLGDFLWANSFGSSNLDFGNSIQQTQDGGYIIAGTTSSSGGGDIFLIKTDANGISGCNEAIPQIIPATWNTTQVSTSTFVTSPSSIAFYDSTFIYTVGIDSTICLVDGYAGNAIPKVIDIFPNPSFSTIFISSSLIISRIKIFNLLGKEFLSQPVSSFKKEIDINSFSSGIYFLELQTEQGIFMRKFIKE